MHMLNLSLERFDLGVDVACDVLCEGGVRIIPHVPPVPGAPIHRLDNP